MTGGAKRTIADTSVWTNCAPDTRWASVIGVYGVGVRAWVNGVLLEDPEQPMIGVSDHGLTVGDGVFEAVKVVDGAPFALRRHLDRLVASAAGLGLPEPDLDAVRAGVDAVLADGLADGLPLGRLRITVTAGPAPLGSGRGSGAPTVIVVAAPMEPAEAATTAVVVPWTRNEHSAVAGLKTTSYAENVVALAWARERGVSEALFANTAGNLCEGTGSNVFYVVDGEVRTPTLDSGCLPGVTRALILRWCPWIVEADEPVEVLRRAEEVFLASTTRDVQPVRALGDRTFVVPGEQTRRVMHAWAVRSLDEAD